MPFKEDSQSDLAGPSEPTIPVMRSETIQFLQNTLFTK